MTQQLEINYGYRVWFSVLRPAEGYMDVEAKNEDDAKKMVMDLVGKNHPSIDIVRVHSHATLESLMKAEVEVQAEEQDILKPRLN